VTKHDAAIEFRERIHSISSRWGDPQEIGALRYIISCFEDLQDGVHDKQAIIKGVSYAWGLNVEFSKFFYQWVLTEMRAVMVDKINMPLTEMDLFKHHYSYTLLPDMLNNVLPWDPCPRCGASLKKMVAIYGGTRPKIPTLTQLARIKENYQMTRDIRASDQDPDSVSKIAKRFGKTEKSAEEVFEEMMHTLNPNRAGEYTIFDDEPSA
jgi:hypothetical protein